MISHCSSPSGLDGLPWCLPVDEEPSRSAGCSLGTVPNTQKHTSAFSTDTEPTTKVSCLFVFTEPDICVCLLINIDFTGAGDDDSAAISKVPAVTRYPLLAAVRSEDTLCHLHCSSQWTVNHVIKRLLSKCRNVSWSGDNATYNARTSLVIPCGSDARLPHCAAAQVINDRCSRIICINPGLVMMPKSDHWQNQYVQGKWGSFQIHVK